MRSRSQPILSGQPDAGGSGKPVRVQLSRAKGWRMPPNTVKVDRTTRWGNPFVVEPETGRTWAPLTGGWYKTWRMRGLLNPHHETHLCFPDYRVGLTKADATRCAVRRFAEVIAPLLDVERLRGKNLACWCAIDAPCHADVLLELANAPSRGATAREAATTPAKHNGNTPESVVSQAQEIGG